MKHRVEHLQDNTYQVYDIFQGPDELYDDVLAAHYNSPQYQGSLSDCEAYVRLKQNENVEF